MSFFRDARAPAPVATVTLAGVMAAIQNGKFRDAIERLRHIRATDGADAYRRAKTSLPAVTFAGEFAPTRAKENLARPSGLCCGDLDHLQDLTDAKNRVCRDPHTAFCFKSPGGDGLKVGVRIPAVAGDGEFKMFWRAIADYFLDRHGLAWDPSGKDIGRLCFLSWDPDLFYTPAAEIWHTHTAETARATVDTPRKSLPAWCGDNRHRHGQRALQTATRMLDASIDGTRHHTRARAGFLLGGYVGGGMLTETEALTAMEPIIRRNTRHFKTAWRTFKTCLDAGMAVVISFEDLERERQDWIHSRRSFAVARRTAAVSAFHHTVSAKDISDWLR